MMQRLFLNAAVALLLACSGVYADGGRFISAGLLELLSENEIPIPDEGIREAMEQVLVGRIDPAAKILTFEEAAMMREQAAALEYARELPRGMLLIKSLTLNQGVYGGIVEAVANYTNQPLKGVILDLRGADGWDVPELKKMASVFLPGSTPIGNVLSGAGRRKTILKSEPAGQPLIQDIPVVVLMDEETQGTAGIFAGVMRGRKNMLLVGRATAGVPCIREFLPMGGGRYLFIATGWVDYGKGERGPVVPDVAVDKDLNEEIPVPGWRDRKSESHLDLLTETYRDEILRRAADYILARARLDSREDDEGKDSEDR